MQAIHHEPLGFSQRVAIPESRVGPCLEHALSVFGAYLIPLLASGAVVFAISAAELSLGRLRGLGWALGIALGIFVAGPLRWAYAASCLRLSQGASPTLEPLFETVERYREVVLASLLVFAMVVAGLFLLVVPGIWVYCRTRFVPYLVINEGLAATDAITESFELTRGLAPTIAGISLLGWIATGLGSLFFGIGALPALIGWDLTLASLYHSVVLSPHEEDLEEMDEILREIVD